MSTFNLTPVTIPTPQPYDDKDPTRQLENLSYVLLQMLDQAKTAGFTFSDAQAELSVDVSGIEAAIQDLKYNSQVIDLGPIKIFLTGKTVSLSPI
jgi:hypothetical protein